MRKLLTFVIILLLLAGGAAAVWQLLGRPASAPQVQQSVDELVNPPKPALPARGPQDYHILADQGGIPKDEAQRAGLATPKYSYLRAITPVQISDGADVVEDVMVRGKQYDMCYRFETRPPEEQFLEFNIGGNWATLEFGFGFSDKEPSAADATQAIVLEIELDGKVAYTSAGLKPVDKPIFTSLPVAGVNRVLFVVRRVGYDNRFTPLLLDPFLKVAAATP